MKKVIENVFLYGIAFVIIVAGVFCGIRLYKEIKAESYVNGSIDISNKFSQESFNYSSTSMVFYRDIYDDTESYEFTKDLLKTENFDGVKNKYNVILNGHVLFNAEIDAGAVYATVDMEFYDTKGSVIHNAEMKIAVRFLSSKTQLTVATAGSESAAFLEQYFADNGIRLQIIQII